MEQMRSKETIVYGGAFNPPTLAHLAILNACIEYAQTAKADVWLMPSGDRTDKTIPTPRETRMAYVEAMIEDANESDFNTEVVSTELDREIMVETYDTVMELQQTHPDRNFTFVFGADSTETMASWKGGDELLETLSMLVVARPGSRMNPMAKRAVSLTAQTPNTSSTEVRTLLAQGESVDHLVGRSVALLLQ